MGRTDSVDWEGRRIGLRRCKKDGEGPRGHGGMTGIH